MNRAGEREREMTRIEKTTKTHSAQTAFSSACRHCANTNGKDSRETPRISCPSLFAHSFATQKLNKIMLVCSKFRCVYVLQETVKSGEKKKTMKNEESKKYTREE